MALTLFGKCSPLPLPPRVRRAPELGGGGLGHPGCPGRGRPALCLARAGTGELGRPERWARSSRLSHCFLSRQGRWACARWPVLGWETLRSRVFCKRRIGCQLGSEVGWLLPDLRFSSQQIKILESLFILTKMSVHPNLSGIAKCLC